MGRKMGMKSAHMEAFIRPQKCFKAVKKLQDLGNPHYIGIKIDEHFMDKAKNQDDHNKEVKEMDEKEDDGKDDDEKEDNGKDDDEKDYDKTESDNRLLAVSKYQSKQDEHTCIVPINPESHVIINDSKRKNQKGRQAKSLSQTRRW